MDSSRLGWLRRRLYYRGAVLLFAVAFAALAVTTGFADALPGRRLWTALFAAAAATSAAVAWKPRVQWLRVVSGVAATTAPAARALMFLFADVPFSAATRGSAVIAWALISLLLHLVWPVVLPPHIDAARLARDLDGDGER